VVELERGRRLVRVAGGVVIGRRNGVPGQGKAEAGQCGDAAVECLHGTSGQDQAPYLIPFLDVTDNVALPAMLAGVSNLAARLLALELLEALDVAHRARAQPAQLSGGEQQRVAIARALVNRPPVILADEPTAPLDSERALAVIRILNQMAHQYRTAVIVVTHDEKIIPTFERIYHIRDGRTEARSGEGRRL
jgi:putative ABC transport system ATP-binding protein